MTLDDLIDALEDLREQYPAAGDAEVIGLENTPPSYDRGVVILELDTGDE
jgi:hypothetical protein